MSSSREKNPLSYPNRYSPLPCELSLQDESRNLTEKLLGPDDNPQSLDFLANEEPGISVDVARYVTNIPFYRSYDDFRPIS